MTTKMSFRVLYNKFNDFFAAPFSHGLAMGMIMALLGLMFFNFETYNKLAAGISFSSAIPFWVMGIVMWISLGFAIKIAFKGMPVKSFVLGVFIIYTVHFFFSTMHYIIYVHVGVLFTLGCIIGEFLGTKLLNLKFS